VSTYAACSQGYENVAFFQHVTDAALDGIASGRPGIILPARDQGARALQNQVHTPTNPDGPRPGGLEATNL